MKAMAAARIGGGTALPVAWVALLASTAPLAAQTAEYEEPTFERSPAEGLPGAVIKVSGTGCIEGSKPYQEARVRIGNGTFVGPPTIYRIRSDGTWSGEYVVPREAPPGDYVLSAGCSAGDMAFDAPSQDYRVLQPAGASTSSSATSTPTTAPPTTVAPPTTRTVRLRPASTSSTSPPSSSTIPTTTIPTTTSEPTVPLAAPRTPRKDSSGRDPALAALALMGGVLALSGGALVAWRRRVRRSSDS